MIWVLLIMLAVSNILFLVAALVEKRRADELSRWPLGIDAYRRLSAWDDDWDDLAS